MKKNVFFNSIYSYVIAIIAFVVWLCSFSYNNEIIKINFDIEMIGFIFYGVVVFLILTFVRDTFYYVPLLICTPLLFGSKIDLNDIDLSIMIMCGLVLLGIIVHIIRFRTTFKLGKFFISLFILLISVFFGGINKMEFIDHFLVIGLGVIIILIIYSFICSYLETHKFYEVCHIMLSLGLLILLQFVFHEIFVSKENMFLIKYVNLGWANNKDIVLVLLFVIPFVMYLSYNTYGLVNFIYILFIFLLSLVVVFLYDKYALLLMGLSIGLFFVYTFIKTKTRINYLINFILVSMLFCALMVLISLENKILWKCMMDNLLPIDLKVFFNLNDELLLSFKDNILLGNGILSLKDNEFISVSNNLYVNVVYSLGIIGVISLMFYLFTKFFILIKKTNLKKVFVLLSLLIGNTYLIFNLGLYSLVYFIMIVCILSLIQGELESRVVVWKQEE